MTVNFDANVPPKRLDDRYAITLPKEASFTAAPSTALGTRTVKTGER